MLIVEELSEELVQGYSEREALMKRFIFKEQGCVFIYQSSVPDEIYSDEESGRDDASRYTLVFSIQCFKIVGEDLILERIRQVDFRQAHSQTVMDAYCRTLNLKALYWQQDIIEKVAEEELKK